jgi:hypothetical protein
MVTAVLLYMAGEVMHLEDSKPMVIIMCGFEIPCPRTFLDYGYSYTDTHVI